MNWFIYIGGGIIFWGVGVGLVKNLLEEKVWKEPREHLFMFLAFTLAPLFIWVWICWRFIRFIK